jgi:hypothetical protein
MKFFQKIVLFTVLFLTQHLLIAQNPKPLVSGTGIIYSSEKSGQFGFTSARGWRLGYAKGTMKTYYKTTLFQLTLGEIKHEKEQRQSSDPAFGRAWRAYSYGKQNNFFALRMGWGAKRYFTEKARQKGVVVGFSYLVGPTLGILKPYYLAVRRLGDFPGNPRIVVEKYDAEENADLFLDNTKIAGAASVFRGFSDPKVTVGGSASLAIHLDWGAFDEYLKALEVGIQLDLFPKKVPILVGENNRSYFVNFFAILEFGKRK